MNKSIAALMVSMVASTALAGLSQAAVQVSQSATAPVDNLIRAAEGYNDSTINLSALGSAASQWRDVGQMFLAPGDLQLESFTLALDSFENQAKGAAFTIKVFATDAAGTALQSGELMATQFGVLPETLKAGEFITFQLDEAVSLASGRYYTVVLHFDNYVSGSAPNRRLLKFQMGSVTGENPLGTGAYYWQSSTTDATQYVRGDKVLTSYFQASAIPEGSSSAMFLGTGLFTAAGMMLRGRWGLRGRAQG